MSTIPPNCETLKILTLRMETAGCNLLQHPQEGLQSVSVNRVFETLAFHPPLITPLVAVAQKKQWGGDWLTREWEGSRLDVLHTEQDSFRDVQAFAGIPNVHKLGSDALKSSSPFLKASR